MAKLLVKLRGEEISRITLESGTEYIAGRAGDAHIQLANERGISRQHLKFYERDGVWICESLSKFVMIHVSGQQTEIIEMSEPTVFSVSPYEFYFEPDGPTAEASDEAAEEPSKNLPTFYNPQANQDQPVSDDTQAGFRVNNEATVAGKSNLVPYIRISFPNTADDEVLKLEGHLWTAGRDPSCEIFIDSPHVSRKHFELARTNEGFFLTDLGSSNGTKLNGLRTPPHEPTRLDSGDELRVMNIVMLFEIRDTQFANRMENLPVPAFDPMFSAPPMQWQTPDMEEATQIRTKLEEIPSDWKKIRPHHLKHVDWKKNKVRVALVVLIPLVLIMAALPTKPPVVVDPTTKGQSVVFENLTVEQKAVVKDSFALARNLYVQGKYEICLTELAKVHEWIPQYENSKELQSFCEQGRELVHRQRDIDRREREDALIQQQITGYVESCKARLTTEATVDETRQCLAEAIELAPEHALVMEMIHTAQMHEDERKFMAQQKADTDKKAAKGVAHYQKAKALYEKGQLAKALAVYDNFLESSYPRIEGQKEIARREVASIKKELKVKVDSLFAQCKTLGGNSKWKEAYLACDKALQEDPSQAETKTYRDQMLGELRREMKSIYEDSVLEESLGNVDSAKEKWRKIIKEDLEFDEYTIKSKSKLQKYGMGG